MNRHEFSMLVVDLLLAMEADGLRPFIDFCKRSDEEQKRLYLQGLSKCDGIVKVSQHQFGKAVDIYFLGETGKLLEWSKVEADQWHEWWMDHGGEPGIPWDLGHFEVK
jgi:hypothetical protein